MKLSVILEEAGRTTKHSFNWLGTGRRKFAYFDSEADADGAEDLWRDWKDGVGDKEKRAAYAKFIAYIKKKCVGQNWQRDAPKYLGATD